MPKQTDIEKGYTDYSDNKTEFAKLKTETETSFDLVKAKLSYVSKITGFIPDQIEGEPELAAENAEDALEKAKEIVTALTVITKAIPRREELREEITNYEKRTNMNMSKRMTESDEKSRKPFNGAEEPI